MKKRFLLLPLVCGIAYMTLTSSTSGYSGNMTGSQSSPGNACGNCHGPHDAGITIAFELDSAGVPVTKYKGGMTYKLIMKGTNTTTNNWPAFGFELSPVIGSAGTSGANMAGSFGTLPSGYRSRTAGVCTYIEQSTQISPCSGTGGSGTVDSVGIMWTAPVAGSGTVTVYGLINAVDNHGNDNSADHWNTASVTFPEWPAAPSSVNEVAAAHNLATYPNPVSAILNIKMENASGTAVVSIYDLAGKKVASENIDATAAASINVSNLMSGVYIVSVENNGTVVSSRIVKN